MRWMAPSKPSLRPASCTGWKTTPRTHDHCSAWSTIAAHSSSLTPARTAQTKVVETPAFSSRSSAWRRIFASLAPRSSISASSLSESNCRYTSKPGPMSASRAAKSGSVAIRTPLVLTIKCRIGRDRAAATISQNWGWIVGSPPESWTRSGSPSARTTRIEHRLDLGQRAMAAAPDRAVGKAYRTAEVAGVVDLNDRQAAVLLVIGAKTAVPRAAPFRAAGVMKRAVAGLEPEASRQPVAGVLLDQRLHHPVLGAALLVENLAVLADDLCGDQFEAGLAQARRLSVEYPRQALAGEIRLFGERVHRTAMRNRSLRGREAGRRRAAQARADRA